MEKNNQTGLKVFIGVLLVVIFIMTLRQSWALRTAGYRASFLASFVSLFDSSLFPALDGAADQSLIPAPPTAGSVTTYETAAITKLAEGLFSSNSLYLYRGSRYNLRVTLGDGANPAVLKNYYINFVRDGVIYRLDSRIDFAIASGTFTTRVLTQGLHSEGVLDIPAGEYEGYVNTVWDTGTQTIKFHVTVLPNPVVVQTVSAPVVTPVYTPPAYVPPVYVPPLLPVSPSFFIEQLAVRDAYGVVQGNVYDYQNSLYAYARMYTSGNGIVYSMVFSSRFSSYQYQLSSGVLEGSGSREISYLLPSMSSLPTGIYELTLVAAPRLSNGTTGNFITRRETINLVNNYNSNPVSVVIPPAPTPVPLVVNNNVVFYGNANLNTQNFITNRQCSDGGDAVNYSVVSLSSNSAVLSSYISPGCLVAGDEVLLINLQGTPGSIGNVGNYELLKIASVSGSTVTFTTNKTRFYGEGASDGNIGTSPSNQRVMLQRVPNYTNATITSGAVLTANAWNGIRGGVVALRTTGNFVNSGRITADGLGYSGGTAPGMQGEGRAGKGITVPHCASYSTNYYGSGTSNNDTGGGSHHCYGSGSGGASANNGGTGFGGSLGGVLVSWSNSSQLLLGGGGGAAAGALGGSGGGIALILGQSFSISGSISAAGASAPGPCGVGTYTYGGGGGAGGSVYLVGPGASISGVSVLSGSGLSCYYYGGHGGNGRAEVGYLVAF